MTWKLTETIDFSRINNIAIQDSIIFLINFISAYGFFNVFVSLIAGILERCQLVKKIILGSSYLEGTWVGYYFTPENTPIVFFQIIEQNTEQIHILTEAYYENKRNRCKWYSISEVSIDTLRSTLNYLYDVDMINKNEQDNSRSLGLFISTFHKKKNGFLKYPCRINGYAFNLNSQTKLKTVQIKYSDSTYINLEEGDINRLIQKAMDFYAKDAMGNLPTPESSS
jgi:hypothetical protein